MSTLGEIRRKTLLYPPDANIRKDNELMLLLIQRAAALLRYAVMPIGAQTDRFVEAWLADTAELGGDEEMRAVFNTWGIPRTPQPEETRDGDEKEGHDGGRSTSGQEARGHEDHRAAGGEHQAGEVRPDHTD